MSFQGSFDLYFDHYYYYYYYYYYYFYLLFYFLAQADFQRQDAMWLHRKATQKKQFAAAII